MSKKKRILLALGLLAVLCLVAVFVTLYAFTGRLARIAQERLSEQLERPVEFASASVSFRSGLGVGVNNLVVHPRESEPQADPLRMDGFHIGIKLLPLLKKRLEISGILLEKPVLDLRVNAAGLSNFTPPSWATSNDASSEFAYTSPIAVFAAASIDNGSLRYEDAQSGMTASVARMDQSLSLKAAKRPEDLAFSGETRLADILVQQLRIPKFEMQFDFAGNRLQLGSLTADIFGGNLTGSGSVDVADPNMPAFTIDAGIQNILVQEGAKVVEVDASAIDAVLDGKSTWQGRGKDLETILNSLTGEVHLESRKFDIKINELLKDYPGGTLLGDLGRLPFTGKGHLLVRNRQIIVDHLTLESDTLQGVITGIANFDETLDLNLRVTLGATYTAALVKKPGGFLFELLKDEAGRVAMDIGITGTLEFPVYSWNRAKTGDLVRSRLNQEVQKRQKLAEEQLKGAGDDILDAAKSGDVSGLKEQLKQRADSAGVGDAKTLQNKAQELLNRFKKKNP